MGGRSRILVIDASVLRAAGGEESVHPTGRNCREFLDAVRRICHRAAVTPAIGGEWRRHRSKFARKWQVRMYACKKIEHLTASSEPSLPPRLENAPFQAAEKAAILKDWPLVEAAHRTDSCVASLDETVRGLLTRACAHVPELSEILWVNPACPDEQAIRWLQDGAPAESSRMLGDRA
jgi:hypothetical protein